MERLQFLSQNVSVNEDKFEEMLAFMREKGVFAFAIQESWKKDHVTVENSGFLMGSNCNVTGKAPCGVVIVMTPSAV